MIRLRTLGPLDLRPGEDGTSSIDLQPRQFALLAYLAAAEGTDHRRDRLLGVFWPERESSRARSALNQTLYGLRQRLGPEAVRSHGNESVSLDRSRVWCDAAAFERHLSEDRPEDALELYRGPFLDGFHVANPGRFERWLDGRRATFRGKAVEAAARLAREATDADDVSEAERWLRKLRELAPGDEEVARQLMRLLQETGRRAAAVRVYRELAHHLRDELDFVPSAETRTLARDIEAAGAARRSVAVLPFRELGPEPVAEGFGAGLAEEILSAVARTGSVRVVGGTSAQRASELGEGLAHIGETLGVDAVVEGSVRRSSDRLRVTARLVRVPDRTTLWADRYELSHTPARIFDAQGEIADSIAEALLGTVARADGEPGVRRPTTDPEAYALYLEGRHAWRRRTVSSLRKALALFRESLDRDPGNALAWSGLADAHALLPIYASTDRGESYDAAREAAARALELDPTLAEARTSLARVHVHRHRWEEAERELRRALESRPSYAPARHWLADLLMRTGRQDEALDEADRLVELEPLSPFAHTGRGFLLYLARDFDGAVEAARRSRSLADSAPATGLEALALLESGDPDRALEVCEMGLERWPSDVRGRAALGCAHVRRGESERARAIARDLGDEPGGAFYGAMVLASAARADETFDLLQRAEWTSLEVDLFASGPPFDPIRPDPRHREQLAELGLGGGAAEAGGDRFASTNGGGGSG